MNLFNRLRFYETQNSKNIRLILEKVQHMTTIQDQLVADVALQTTINQSAITLLQGLKNRLDMAIAANQQGDPTQLAALSASLEANNSALAAAITANTPVDVPPANGTNIATGTDTGTTGTATS